MTAITWNALSHRYMSLSAPDADLSRAHPRKHPFDMDDRRLRQDSMPQIEDEGSLGKGLERQIDGAVECSATDEQHEGVEISLHRQTRLELAGESRIDRPVKTDGVHSNILRVGHKRGAGPAWKSDDLCAGQLAANLCDDASGGFDAPSAQLFARQNPGPSIEDLHRVDPRLELPE